MAVTGQFFQAEHREEALPVDTISPKTILKFLQKLTQDSCLIEKNALQGNHLPPFEILSCMQPWYSAPTAGAFGMPDGGASSDLLTHCYSVKACQIKPTPSKRKWSFSNIYSTIILLLTYSYSYQGLAHTGIAKRKQGWIFYFCAKGKR